MMTKDVTISVRLSADDLARVDVERGDVSRSTFVRRAVAVALLGSAEWRETRAAVEGAKVVQGAVQKPVEAKPPVAVSGRMNPIPDRGKAEIALLLEALRVRPMTAREAAKELDLPEMKVTAMEKALSQADMIEYLAPGVMRVKPAL